MIWRQFYPRAAGEHTPSSDLLVSSARVSRLGSHDRVEVWNRGALCGVLVVQIGDGERIAELLGLEERSTR